MSVFLEFHFRLNIYSGNASEFENLRSSSFDGVYMTTSAAIAHYNMKNFRKGHIAMTKDKILLLPYAIYFRKNSCLEKTINLQIGRFSANGLISVWTDDLTHEKLAKVYLRSERFQMRVPKKLSMDQFWGVFVVCMLMYVISAAIFVMELVAVRFKFIRVLLDFCTLKKC